MADYSGLLKFGGGVSSRATEDDIEVQECALGENFDLDLKNRDFVNRKPFDLVGTAPNGQEIRGFASLKKADGTVSLLVQAGSTVYEWDGITFICEPVDWVTYDTVGASGSSTSATGIFWASGLELFIATFDGGDSSNRIQTSPDGINWTARAATGALRGGCWSEDLGLAVVVGSSGAVLTSPDGITWASRTAANLAEAVVWCSSLSLFVKTGGIPESSPDGITWTPTSSPARTSDWRDITWSESLGRMVMVNGTLSTSTNTTVWSDDGINWSNAQSTGSSHALQRGIAYSDDLGKFCIVGINGRSYVSTDGKNWTSHTGVAADKVVWSPERAEFAYVYSSSNPIVKTSPDGEIWTNLNAASSPTGWRDIAWSPSILLYVICTADGTGGNGGNNNYVQIFRGCE